MQAIKDSSRIYEVERRSYYAARPGFRTAEMQTSPTQIVPWHFHNEVQDTFYVIAGTIRVFTRDPEGEILLRPGDTYSVRPRQPHMVTNTGSTSATFLVLQGKGDYDFLSVI
jgi:mannose-6-phosphate isomerase-like protein (cupin superfamily)